MSGTRASSFGPRTAAPPWGGLVARAGTPRDIVLKLNAAANKALQTQEVSQTMRDNASQPQGGSRRNLLRSSAARWFWGNAGRLTSAKAG